MKTLTIDLDDEQAAALKRAAESEGRSETDLARDAVIRYAQRHPSAVEPSDDLPDTNGDVGRGRRRLRTFAMSGAVDGSEDRPLREFAMDGAVEGPGGSIADVPEEELLKGFGE